MVIQFALELNEFGFTNGIVHYAYIVTKFWDKNSKQYQKLI